MQAPELVPAEHIFLRALPHLARCRRVQDLHASGWSLQSIANAFSPPRRRSTVRAWVCYPIDNDDLMSYYPRHLAPALISPPKKKIRVRSSRLPSPGISHATQIKIARLSPLARRYRSRTPQGSPSHVANQELSQLAAELFSQNVRVSEIARAQGVSYRATKRRIEKHTAQQEPAPAPAAL